MSDRNSAPATLPTGALAAICCVGPLLIAAVGAAGLTEWFANSVYVLIPGLVVGLGGLWLYRRRMATLACCQPTSSKQGVEQ